MALSRIAPAVTVGLMACSGAEVTPVAGEGYGLCSVASGVDVDPYDKGAEFVDDPFGTIVAEQPVAMAGYTLPQKATAKVEALRVEFVREAERQVALVRDAGGYCNLPQQPDHTTSEEYEYSQLDHDDRLGDKLANIVEERDKVIGDANPAWPGQLDWHVKLDRIVECDFVEDWSLDDFKHSSEAIWALPLEDLQTLQDDLNQQIGEWNDVCAEARGGIFQGRLHEDPFAGAKILVERGRALSDAIGEPATNMLFAHWREKFRDDVFTGSTVHTDFSSLADLEYEQFLGSHWFAEQVLGDGNAYWTCPVDDHIADGGFERDAKAGIIYTCSPDDRLEGEIYNGVKIPLSVYETSVDGM